MFRVFYLSLSLTLVSSFYKCYRISRDAHTRSNLLIVSTAIFLSVYCELSTILVYFINSSFLCMRGLSDYYDHVHNLRVHLLSMYSFACMRP